MRTILAVILAAAAAIAGGWWIAHLSGGVVLHIESLTIQAPLSVALMALIAFSIALTWLYRILAALFGLGHVLRRRGERNERKRGEQAVTATLVALAAREGADAKRAAAKARKHLGETPNTLLLSAYAGNIAGDKAMAREAFEKLAARKDAALLGLRGLIGHAVDQEDWTGASELAKQAEAVNPGTSWLRAERGQMAAHIGDWQEALLLHREDAPHAALGAAAADDEEDRSKALKLAKDAFKRDPGLPAATLAYARRLRETGYEKQAQLVLQQGWARTPHPDIASFALEPAPDRLARLAAGQALVLSAAESGDSHLLLARLNLEAGQTDAAQREAEAAERAGLKQRRLYMLLADIAEAGGDDAASLARYREALKTAAAAAPDPAWVCGNCGTVAAEWQPSCPKCKAVGRIGWTAK